jgi:hypothetical protein
MAGQHRKSFKQTKGFIDLIAKINELFAAQRRAIEDQ